ncbi:hypothetical protein BpHYR1_035209 [Brachionus plicatilis]|uniref:Uncharacterized protein n=1 Tax=Brachionus plicatilis TaxID=10195 RepID=A0A3M7T962_BRAPC|nr:hypothetical protein BpHYR1_035209 [Brachionus plicatilis]
MVLQKDFLMVCILQKIAIEFLQSLEFFCTNLYNINYHCQHLSITFGDKILVLSLKYIKEKDICLKCPKLSIHIMSKHTKLY